MALDTVAVRERLRLVLGEFVDVDADEDGDLYLEHATVRAYVQLTNYQDEHTCLGVTMLIASGLTLQPAVFRWVAVKSVHFRFGALSAVVRADDRIDVTFSHSLLIDDITDERLRATVLPVVFTGSDLREEAHSLFSGE